MVTVAELTEPYASFLIHPIANGPGVCTVCRSAWSGNYQRCYPCNEAHRAGAGQLADVVVPISIAVKGDQLAVELWRYKNLADAQARAVLQSRLASVLWRFAAMHEACIADYAGASEFDSVTVVPSTSGRVDQPLRHMVASMIPHTRDRYVDLLVPNPVLPADRQAHLDRFLPAARSDIRGSTVLLIDDTWTTGAHAQSAAWTLKRAGAARVAILVVGRHFVPSFADNSTNLRVAKQRRFSWEHCCVHTS